MSGEADRLQAVAAELALEWITGERRFESQSQQTEYWLARLYMLSLGLMGLGLINARWVARKLG